MLKDITLGQYFPGDTVAHRLDPRTKLILVLLYIVALFQASGWVGYALVLLATLVCMAVSHISPKNIFKGLKPMLFIIALTALLNIFYTTGTPIRPGWIVTWEGIERAVKMMLRITLLIAGTFLLTYTTSPMALTDGLELLLNPLKKLHVPVHEMTIMMSMALRFIPTLIEETDKIMSAQKARGADFENGNLLLIMDPPSYGRGPGGEVWKLEQNLWPFVSLCAGVLSDEPLFVLVNSYTTGLSPSVLSYVSESIFTKKFGGRSDSQELALPVSDSGLYLPCGASCRWER